MTYHYNLNGDMSNSCSESRAHTLWIFSDSDRTDIFPRSEIVAQDTAVIVLGDIDSAQCTYPIDNDA